ncbi:hypothetical protein LSM04_000093 [Trypanosoma melophagium]|uniref:uncharacterized protein n=1 Tax=Trypanosoma melophagium TaxID=715481 RepID=UPI003519FAA3|nr:hypothetical protein LSM04_000093 [Trypanosoma melophagium]
MGSERVDASSAQLMLLRAVFPYVSRDTLAAAAREAGGGGAEAAVRLVNDRVNPNITGGDHLRSVADGRPAVGAGRQQQERAALLEEKPHVSVGLNEEYRTAVGVFAVDTAAWDEHFFNGASLTDLVGGRPLVLPEEKGSEGQDGKQKGTDVQTPIVRWAPTLETLKEREIHDRPNRVNASEEVPPVARLLEAKTMKGEDHHSHHASSNRMEERIEEMTVINCNTSSSSTSNTIDPDQLYISTLLTPLQFSRLAIHELTTAIDKLAEWKSVFSYHDSCQVMKEIAIYNPAVVSLMPEITSNILAAMEEKLKGVKLLHRTEGINISFCGGYIVNFDELFIDEILFGRSYGRFESNGRYLSLSFKVKRLTFRPTAISYRKAKSKNKLMKIAVCNIVLSGLKVKANVEVYLYTSGRAVIRCSDVSVSIDSLYIDSKSSITQFLRKTITIGSG